MEFISGEKFIKLSDFIYSIRLPGHDDYYNLINTYNKIEIEKFERVPIIYCHTHISKALFSLIDNLDKDVILITHNSDNNIDEKLISNIPGNIIKWYTQNLNVNHFKIESLPIGLENKIWFPHINKQEKIKNILTKKIDNKNLLYVNHNINTNLKEREEPYIIFKDKNFVTLVEGKNGYDFDSYLTSIKSHKFILCPNGNGIDTHRLWEVLYLKSIPIVKRGINTLLYQDLPICYVDDWKEITEDFLNKEYKRINNTKWNLEKLDFNFWKDKITKR
jgi:hypothetical protein